MKRLIIIPILLCFFVIGCTTTQHVKFGHDFDASKSSQIVKNKSVKNDVLALFGEPTDKTLDENYNEKWEYTYSERADKISLWDYSSKGELRTKKLTIIFDKNDIVQNYVFSDSSEPITSGK